MQLLVISLLLRKKNSLYLNSKTNMKRTLLITILMLIFSGLATGQEFTSEEIFSKAKDAVVVIYAYDYNGKVNSQGSGVVIKDKGIIVTNFHVFAGNERLEVKHNDNVIPFKEIIGIDIENDILILKIEENNFPSLEVGNTDNVKIGEKVYAIGSPMGFENTISDGLVSGLRVIGKNNKNYIQITASISPGSSGGAVLNSKCELIGISTMVYSKGQNLNFAIGMNDIMEVTLGQYTDKIKLEALNFFFKGQKLQEDGDYDGAINYYNKYLKIFPNDAKAYNYRGLVYENKKDFGNAIIDFTHAIKLDPKYAPSYSNRGECYFKTEENEKAIKDFSSVIKIEPENISAYYARGLVRSKEEEYTDAIRDYTKVININPYYVEAYLSRGLAYYYNSDYERAIIDWKKCIKLDGRYAPDLNRMIDNADLLWQHGIK